MDDGSDRVADLLSTAEAFLMPLRSGEGYRDDLFHDLCEAIRSCGRLWQDSDSIPKLAANLFVDLASGIEASSYAYSDSQEAETIQKASYIIGDLVRETIS